MSTLDGLVQALRMLALAGGLFRTRSLEVVMETPGIDHICGPRIAGTRITVYDVFYYLEAGWRELAIAELFGLSVQQIQAAVDYIEAHKAHVLAVHQQIEERNARGNPPEIEEKLKASRAKMQAWLEERRHTKPQEANGAGDSR